MNPVLQRESLLALDDLRDALSRIDTAAWRDELEAAVRARVEVARERLRGIAAAAESSSDMGAARERVHALLATLDALPSPRESALSAWTSFRASASQRIDSLSDSLRDLSTARARPSNLARSFFHAAAGLAAVAAIALLHDRRWLIAIALPWACFAWTSELLRRRYRGANLRLMRVLGPIAHPHEWHKVNSATWFVTALLLLATLAPLRSAALGCAVLALGDPAAALVGRRWGRRKIAQNRTLEGALAFVAVGTLVSLAVVQAVPGAPASPLLLALTAGVVGALTELYSGRVDDNLSIPVVTAVAVTLVERLGR
jgi:dolichol kinase